MSIFQFLYVAIYASQAIMCMLVCAYPLTPCHVGPEHMSSVNVCIAHQSSARWQLLAVSQTADCCCHFYHGSKSYQDEIH